IDLLYFNTPTGKSSLPIFPGGLAGFSPIDFSALAGMPGLPSFTSLEALDPNLRTPFQTGFLKVLSGLLPATFPGFPSGLHLYKLSIPLFYTQGFGDPRLITPAIFFSGYIQDDLKLKPNLLLKFGIRYDIDRERYIPDNGGNVSPRIAISYRPTLLKRV